MLPAAAAAAATVPRNASQDLCEVTHGHAGSIGRELADDAYIPFGCLTASL